MNLDFEGHTALVTGASKGIGRAIATRLAEEGCRVVLCARGKDALNDAVDEIRSCGGAALGVVCDVLDRSAPRVVLQHASNEFGAVDILINNAGLATSAKLIETTDEEWEVGMDLNFLSAVRFTRACLPAMVERSWGRIVNVSSTAAKVANPYTAIYGAAKAAMVNYSKAVSAAFAADGIRCNCVLPGITRTELVEANMLNAVAATGRTPEEVMARTLRRTPIPAGRIGEPMDVADAVVFLASGIADWITGVALPVDGGTIPVAG